MERQKASSRTSWKFGLTGFLTLSLAFALSLYGCDTKGAAEPVAATKSPADSAKPVAESTSVPASSATDPKGAGSPPAVAPTASPTKPLTAGSAVSPTPAAKPEAPKAAQSVVPAALKTEGFSWYGLDSTKPVDLVLSIPSQKKTVTGSASMTFSELKNGVAKFGVTRSGALQDLFGDEEVEARPDGIYVVGNTKGKLSVPTLDLPGSPKPGFSWRVKSVLKTEKESIQQNILCKVVGVVPLKENGQTIQALLVKTSGTVTLNGKPTPTEAKYWYAKGVGLIRTDLTVTPAGQKPVLMIMTRPSNTPQSSQPSGSEKVSGAKKS